MLSRVRSAFYNVVQNLDAFPVEDDQSDNGTANGVGQSNDSRKLKFSYSRPQFLQLDSSEEIQASADHTLRPILVPRNISLLPWTAGYAETINAGKSARNEDQGACHAGAISPERGCAQILEQATPNELEHHLDHCRDCIPYRYFALFDGHAGAAVAVAASRTLHRVIHLRLQQIAPLLRDRDKDGRIPLGPQYGAYSSAIFNNCDSKVTVDTLITGALETAFLEMDSQIARDKKLYKMPGGCTVLVAIFIFGKLYLANAGDSRAIVCRCTRGEVIPMSQDFTPESERHRVKLLAQQRPELLGNDFTYLEFLKRPTRADIGRKLLYRDVHMTGWAFKTITPEDLRLPVVCGEGKRSRVLATIGVTRGFGDHDLKSQLSPVAIKPFLSAEPEVRIFEVSPGDEIDENDVLVMATDGLWDVTNNERTLDIVKRSLSHFSPNASLEEYKYRYVSAAQDLVMQSRGKISGSNWRTSDNRPATVDDISVFVIPLRDYKREFERHVERMRKLEEEEEKISTLQAADNGNEINGHLERMPATTTPGSVSLTSPKTTNAFDT
ncbi:protein phosphatase 1H-like [Varroa jacobsoni]|uniref:PPM-type phosphatase domain-containing protein n=1 Tax=Varroa destructor TaxID=109461 RepID=A0A7M7KVI6_VARDE|nr:protein phosphatase 1H-like [Varroa destructor]XP_022700211.1 protein phosphatase 1H-like [Varroa jacobsoni]